MVQAVKQYVQKKSSTVADTVHERPLYGWIFASICLVILLGTTFFWAGLGARIHASNADQLIDAYLFESKTTFQQASFPAPHTFLMKWPLFLLIKLLGFSERTFMIFTVGMVGVTVGFLAWLLYRIERRPVIFGMLCLGLACVLLAVPAQPYPGGILPVNMAMITTRNLEYVLYIGSLLLLLKSNRSRLTHQAKPSRDKLALLRRSWPQARFFLPMLFHGISNTVPSASQKEIVPEAQVRKSYKSLRFWTGVGLLGILIASDKLFLTFSVGAALLALVTYAALRRWSLTTLVTRWLLAGMAASICAVGVIWGMQHSGLTHFADKGFAATPYGFSGHPKDLMLGGVYALLGLLTNFGANPASDTRLLHHVPSQVMHTLASPAGFVYVVNALIFLGGLYAVYKLIKASITHHKELDGHFDTYGRLGLMLVWTSIVAILAYIVSRHYYPVDARYLTIALFAIALALGVAIKKHQVKAEWALVISAVLLIGVGSGLYAALQNYHADKAALRTYDKRNRRITQILGQHRVDVLVGDYWRVVPIKLATKNRVTVMPLGGCTEPRVALSSQHWHKDIRIHSFAYLLSLDQNLTDSPKCSLQSLTQVYGRPNSSTVIEGDVENPKEVLLFYDQGIRGSLKNSRSLPRLPASVVPIQLKDTLCAAPTVMNVVAHQDDDLLFMSPDLIHDLQAGHCVRTIYITAGDAGQGEYYWLSREQGSQAAYSDMTHSSALWIQRIVKISEHQFITVASPKGNPSLSLIYLHLPDGGVRGDGFKFYHLGSIKKLEVNLISSIETVDGHSSYSSADLIETLTLLMEAYRPAEIRTQAGDHHTTRLDHSDHMTAGRYVTKAYAAYLHRQYEDRPLIPLKFYAGYPIALQPQNVLDPDLAIKQSAFAAYSRYDAGVCLPTRQPCVNPPIYLEYLKRQYLEAY